MHIHEYQAKSLFAEHHIPILNSHLITLADNVSAVCETIEDRPWIVKAQVHAGGRGKAGGVVRAENRKELITVVNKMLGSSLKTNQTGETGLPINAVLLEEIIQIKREIYLAILVDRTCNQIAIIASAEGGMDIEKIAQEMPDKIITNFIHPAVGLQANQVRNIAYALKFEKSLHKSLQKILQNLYEMFLTNDCSLVEINPLIVDDKDQLIALDAKINLDSNALYRHEALQALYDSSQHNAAEVRAEELGLNYVKLDGNIGCIVNGAGLAMATMDLVKHYGGAPANFLDVGGGATKDKVTEAFNLVLSDLNVNSIFVNIFGGIVRCDLIAQGVLDAIHKIELKVPVTVLLQGTNAEEGKNLLENQSANIFPVTNLTEGAQRAIQLAGGK